LKGIRSERMAEEVRREISEVLLNHAGDQRLSLVGVTRVELSRDLSYARVYVSAMGDEQTQETSLRLLVRAAGFIRGELGRRLRMRRVPELRFQSDPGIRYSIKLQQILKELGLTEAEPGSGDADVEG
jgi:ribosome-binding factor A